MKVFFFALGLVDPTAVECQSHLGLKQAARMAREALGATLHQRFQSFDRVFSDWTSHESRMIAPIIWFQPH
jgi:hypothetical protein